MHPEIARIFIAAACTLIRASDLTDAAFEIAVEDKTSYYDSLFPHDIITKII
jgi:hypothetical protein